MSQIPPQKFDAEYVAHLRELLDIARNRLKNDTNTEVRVATGEQQKITRLRFDALIGKDAG